MSCMSKLSESRQDKNKIDVSEKEEIAEKVASNDTEINTNFSVEEGTSYNQM